MVERTKLNHILQLAQHKQKQASDRGDLFKEMVNSSMKSMDKTSQKREKVKSKEDNPKASKEITEKTTAKKETEKTDKTDEKADTSLDSISDSQPDKTLETGRETSVNTQVGLTDALGIMGHLAEKEMFKKGQDITIDPETKIHTKSEETFQINSAGTLNQEDLKKQLDNALLFRPEIKDKSQEINQPTNFAERMNTADLKDTIKELTGQRVEVEFKSVAKEDKIENLIDNLLGQSESIADMDIKPVTLAEKASEPFEKIFVKVSDGAELTPKVAMELRDKILISQTDAKNYEMQLNPANLGKIFVKVSMENGVTNLEMHFTSKKTMELMKGNMGDLTQIIANNRGTEVTVHMTEQKAPDYLDQNEQQQGNAQEHKQKEEQRQSDEFINRLKETLKQEKAI